MKKLISTILLIAIVLYLLVQFGYINLTDKGTDALRTGGEKTGEILKDALQKGSDAVADAVANSIEKNGDKSDNKSDSKNGNE